jgi:hypothetical protein
VSKLVFASCEQSYWDIDEILDGNDWRLLCPVSLEVFFSTIVIVEKLLPEHQLFIM